MASEDLFVLEIPDHTLVVDRDTGVELLKLLRNCRSVAYDYDARTKGGYKFKWDPSPDDPRMSYLTPSELAEMDLKETSKAKEQEF